MKIDTNKFKNKKVTVMRIGLLGRGVGDTAWLAEQGADVLVVDSALEEVMQVSVDALRQYKNVTFKFGPYDISDFVSCDYVLVGAGAPLDSPELKAAKEAGVALKQSASWFTELSKVPIIGVTGTRGKSTVTHMIHHVLSEVTGENVLLGGNIRDLSNLQLLNDVEEDSLCVMELDSWQLQSWGWSEMSPQISVFTNFMEDHLNYYQATDKTKEEAMHLYLKDKANIFRYQDESSVFVTTPEVFELIKQLEGVSVGQEMVLVDSSDLPEDTLLSMPGEHNRLNAALAYKALKAVSLTDDEIFEGLASFKGVAGRLEYLGERKGVKIYNDNNSTAPQATIKGLQAVGDKDNKNVILIAGGADKGIDTSPLLVEASKYCKKVILLSGTATDLIKDKIEADVVSSIEEAVTSGLAVGSPGDVLLFSPGFSSFGMFKNEYERNDSFVACINGIEE